MFDSRIIGIYLGLRSNSFRILAILCLVFNSYKGLSQQGTFIAIGAGGLFSINTNDCSSTPLTSSCSNFAGSALSIALDNTTLYINDNQGNLYSITLGSSGTVGNCDSLGKFLSGSGKIYGLTVGPSGVVYAASGSLIETYNPNTKAFGTLGSLPSNLSIGGDLLFYQGNLYEMCTNNNLVLVDTLQPSKSHVYEHFNSTETIFGLASVTVPCSPNQVYAVANSGYIYSVAMNHTNQALTNKICTNSFGKINDAASIAETQSTPPPNTPAALSPVVYCVNSAATALTASTSGSNDTLNWYTSLSGGVSSVAPTPIVGSTQTTTTYYVSQTDITTGCESDKTPIVVNVDTFSSPKLVIEASATTVCSGATVSFLASPTKGGTLPFYQWKVNGLDVGSDTSLYLNDSLKDGSLVTCKLTSNEKCILSPNAISNTIAITVNTIDSMPTIHINASDTSFCPGTIVTFKAVISNGGKSPQFIWRQNGVVVGNNDSIYQTNGLVNGDTITCGLISSYAICLLTDTIKSNKIRMSVTAKILPTLSIYTDTTIVCSGVPVTFTSSETHGGTVPSYYWRINGKNALNGNASVFTTTSLKNNDVVSCTLVSNEACLITNTAQSSITMKVLFTPDSVITIRTSDTNICPGAKAIFVATSPRKLKLDWAINGVYIETNSSDSFESNIIRDGDSISCRFVTDYGCGIVTIISNPIVVRVVRDIPPTIVVTTDTTTICKGSTLTFSAVTTNGGVKPYYQWMVNGNNVGGDSARLNTSILSDGDKVSCSILSDIGCLTKKDGVSVPLKITVVSPPVVSPIEGEDSVCQGKSITLTNKSLGGKWISNVENIVTIDSVNGIVSGHKSGLSTISYSVKNSCGTTTQSVVMTVVDSPNVFIISGLDSVCVNSNITLTEWAKGGVWSSDNDAVATVDKVNGVVSGLNAGRDSIKYTISNSCGTDYKAKLIYVVGERAISSLIINQQPNCIAPSSGSITVKIKGSDKYYQYGINGNLYSNDSAATNLIAGTYEALIYNSLGCVVDIIPFELKLKIDGTCDTLYVPTVFIPYGSFSEWKELRPYGGSSIIKSISFKVYNRYGNLVYESHELNRGWNGTTNGLLQEAGAYVWYLSYSLFNGPPKEMKGTSVLLR